MSRSISKKSESINDVIPKILIHENGKISEENILEGCFEDWKRGRYLQRGGKIWEAINVYTGVIAAIK